VGLLDVQHLVAVDDAEPHVARRHRAEILDRRGRDRTEVDRPVATA